MNFSRFIALLLLCSVFSLTACNKEKSSEVTNEEGGCNNAVMKIKRWQALFNPEEYIEAEWNTNGSVKMVKLNTLLSEYQNATYIYDGSRIKEAVLRNNNDNSIYDTAVFHYNIEGKVDSMYLKNNDWFDIKLTYVNGKLKKYTRYASKKVMFYWDIETDSKGNIVSAVEWWDDGGSFIKQSTMTFTRDDKKNPFEELAPYMFYLDDDYNIFWHWGPNNYTNQNYVDHTGTGTDLTTGYKFKYNNNCYPASSQTTIAGQVVFAEDDFQFTYY